MVSKIQRDGMVQPRPPLLSHGVEFRGGVPVRRGSVPAGGSDASLRAQVLGQVRPESTPTNLSIIFSLIKADPEVPRSGKYVFARLQERYPGKISAEELAEVLQLLERRKMVTLSTDGEKIKYYNHVEHIEQVAFDLKEACEGRPEVLLADALALIQEYGRKLFFDYRISLSVDDEAKAKHQSRYFDEELEKLYGCVEVGRDGLEFYWQASESGRKSFYSFNYDRDTINRALDKFNLSVAHCLNRVVRAQRTAGLIPRNALSSAEPVMYGEPFRTDQYARSSRKYTFGPDRVEYNPDAARLFRPIMPLVVTECNEVVADRYGERMPFAELEDHICVRHTFIDRVDDKVIGFAFVDDHDDFKPNPDNQPEKVDRLIYYAGVMFKKAFEGGRLRFLTLLIMWKVFTGLGLFRLFFQKTPITFRIQDKRLADFAGKYFFAKTESANFSAQDWQALNFTAQKRRTPWGLEQGANICRDCYSRRMVDDPKYLLPGLGEKDGLVGVGYLNWKTAWLLFFDFGKYLFGRQLRRLWPAKSGD